MLHPTDDQSLLQEIEEDLQRQRFEALWKRFGPAVLTVMVLIVIGTSAYSAWQNYTTRHQEARTDQFIGILEQADKEPPARIADLEAFEAAHPGTSQALLARLHEAGLLVGTNQPDKAVAVYETIAADTSVETFFRQMATFLSIQTQLDKGDPAKLAARLETLMGADSPYRYLAAEYHAHLTLKQGDKGKAREEFKTLIARPGAPVSVVKRATDMLGWLDGGA